jgi:hypothetical protein
VLRFAPPNANLMIHYARLDGATVGLNPMRSVCVVLHLTLNELGFQMRYARIGLTCLHVEMG